MKLKASELKQLITTARDRSREIVESTRLDSNPQVVEVHNRHKGARDAFQAILDALNGDPVMLKIEAGKL